MYMLVRMSQHVNNAQDTGSFLSVIFGSCLVKVKRNFDKFIVSLVCFSSPLFYMVECIVKQLLQKIHLIFTWHTVRCIKNNKRIMGLLVPYHLSRGALSLLAVRQSVPLSHFNFPDFSQLFLRYWVEIRYMNLSWHNTDHAWLLSHLTHLHMNYLLLLNLFFRTFLCCLLRYWLEIWYMH